MYSNLYNTVGMGDCEKVSAAGYQCDPEEELTSPEIEELRKKRNEANDLAANYQKQIDEAFIALHNVPDFTGKWVKITHPYETDREWVEHVIEMERTKRGIRLRSDKQLFRSEDGKQLTYMYSKDSDMVEWKDVDKIEVLEEDAVKQYMSCAFEKTLEAFFE